MKRSFLAVLAALVLVAMGASPLVSGAQTEDGYIYLFNDGADDNASATTDWRFYVETPDYVGLDAYDGYWNFTAYGQMVNNTGSAATGAYTVTIYIEADGLNRSASGAITVSKTATVYGNVSFPEATYELFEANDSAAVYVKLTNATGVLKDSWTGELMISTHGIVGMTTALVGTVVGLAIVVMVIGWFGNAMGDMGKSFRKGGGSRQKKKR